MISRVGRRTCGAPRSWLKCHHCGAALLLKVGQVRSPSCGGPDGLVSA
jgi:hypothetical protein